MSTAALFMENLKRGDVIITVDRQMVMLDRIDIGVKGKTGLKVWDSVADDVVSVSVPVDLQVSVTP